MAGEELENHLILSYFRRYSSSLPSSLLLKRFVGGLESYCLWHEGWKLWWQQHRCNRKPIKSNSLHGATKDVLSILSKMHA